MKTLLLAAVAALIATAPAHAGWRDANRTPPPAPPDTVRTLAAPPPALHDRTPQRVAGICFMGIGVMHCVDAVNAAHRNAQRSTTARKEGVWRPLSEGLVSIVGGLGVYSIPF